MWRVMTELEIRGGNLSADALVLVAEGLLFGNCAKAGLG